MGIKTRHFKSEEEAIYQEILFQASQLKRHAAGIYGLGNFLIKARNKIVEIIRKNLEDFGSCEISLPVLQPKFLWEESGRWETYCSSGVMFNFSGRNGEYCLAPTGEEVVVDFAKQNIVSYKDLPINIFQIGNKYRDELRVRGGLLRSKEFLMKDAYSFHASFDDMVLEYESMKKCYFKIFSDLNLDVVAVKAISGDIGGKVSEEFMCFSEIGEDKIYINKDKTLALNQEVLENQAALEELKKVYPNLDINSLEKKNCLELGHIFQLGQLYSKKMDGFFVDETGEKKPYYMGCYGIGINRVLGAICELNRDEQGLIWPKSVAPYQCVIIYNNENQNSAEELYLKLKQNGVEVVIFDKEATFGSKIKDSKLLGFRYIIILGGKFSESGLFEVEKRVDSTKLFLKDDELIKFLKEN